MIEKNCDARRINNKKAQDLDILGSSKSNNLFKKLKCPGKLCHDLFGLNFSSCRR